jgi:osmotically-inducible protein OsmY
MTTIPLAALPTAAIAPTAESHDTDDHPLHSRVLQALAMQTHLAGKNLRFETRAGRVTIHGKVRSYFLKQMAQETLKGIEGVSQIDNRMTVDWEHDAPKMSVTPSR